MPDLLGFHSGRVRLTGNTLLALIATHGNKDLYIGMQKHISLDKLFHTSEFFKSSNAGLQTRYYQMTGETLPHFNAHIIVEMLIDKWILHHSPEYADKFYNTFRSIEASKIADDLASLENFDARDMIELLNRFALSTYVGEYTDVSTVIKISNRVSAIFSAGRQLSSEQAIYPLSVFYEENSEIIQNFLSSIIKTRKTS